MQKKFLATLFLAMTALLMACGSQQSAVPDPNANGPSAVSRSESRPVQPAYAAKSSAASDNKALAPPAVDASQSASTSAYGEQPSIVSSTVHADNDTETDSSPSVVEDSHTPVPESLAAKKAEPAPVVQESKSVDDKGSSDTEQADSVVAKETIIEPEALAQEDSLDALSEVFFLRVISPEEDTSFVEAPVVEIAGLTPLDAAVSVNDEIVDVDENGRFGATVELEEGPNIIEVVASNSDGEEEDMVLTVFYLP